MNAERVTIVANGQPQEVNLPSSVAGFIGGCGWKTTQVVVEYNGKVLVRGELARVMLKAGDRIEIIVPVAGG